MENFTFEITPPPNRTGYTAFRLRTGVDYEFVDVIYNYSWLFNTTVRARNLELSKCAEEDLIQINSTTYNCTADSWISTSAENDVNGTTLRKTFANLSLFSIGEGIGTTTTFESITNIAGGSSSSEAKKKTVASLSFVAPKQPLVLYSKDRMTVVFVVKNTGRVTLNDIKLDAYTDTKDLSLQLERDKIQSLGPGAEAPVRLFIESHTQPAIYEITITATPANAPLVQTSKIYITLQPHAEVIVTEQLFTEMRSAEDILKKNPKCFELREFLTQAEVALKEQDYAKARALAAAAIEGCQELIAYSVELEKPAPLIDLEKLKTYLIIGLSLVSALLLIMGYLFGTQHRHIEAPIHPRHPAYKAVKRISGGGIGRSVLRGKLARILGKKKEAPLELEVEAPKSEKTFITKRPGAAPSAPFYLPRGRGKF